MTASVFIHAIVKAVTLCKLHYLQNVRCVLKYYLYPITCIFSTAISNFFASREESDKETKQRYKKSSISLIKFNFLYVSSSLIFNHLV